MRSALIIVVFLAVKTLQWLNSFALARFFSIEESAAVMMGVLFFVCAAFVFGFIVKTFFPKAIYFAWIFIVLALIITTQINTHLAIIFLSGLFLYALIGTEGQVIQTIADRQNIPKFITLMAAFLPVAISYLVPQARVAPPQLFYIISSLFAFLASYSAQKYGGGKFIFYQKAPPAWLGLFFLAGSGLLYYLGSYGSGTPFTTIIPFVLLFYVGGALVIYLSIDAFLQCEPNKQPTRISK